MKTLRRIQDTIWTIKDCRRIVRKDREHGLKTNTRFLAHLASIPEWTLVIFNK